jgi:hypothetical protein
MKKFKTHHYSLKYKKLNMQICQFWSVVNFLLKINRLFLIRDANFKMNKRNKNPSNSRFSTSFFAGETENKINFDIITEKQ